MNFRLRSKLDNASAFLSRKKWKLQDLLGIQKARVTPEVRGIADALKQLPVGTYELPEAAFPKDMGQLASDYVTRIPESDTQRRASAAQAAQQAQQTFPNQKVAVVIQEKGATAKFDAWGPGMRIGHSSGSDSDFWTAAKALHEAYGDKTVGLLNKCANPDQFGET